MKLTIAIDRYRSQPTTQRLCRVILELGQLLKNPRQNILHQVRSIRLIQSNPARPIKDQGRIERDKPLPRLFIWPIRKIL